MSRKVFLLCIPLAMAAFQTGATAAEISERLARILEGGVPETVDDLRAMETHFQGLSDRLRPVTVGVRIGRSQGSGVIVSADGLVLTAAHVIGRGESGRRVTLVLHDGRTVEGETLGANFRADSGLVRITEPGPWPFVGMGHSGALNDGQWCLAIGHPGGYQRGRTPPVRVGRVVRKRRNMVTTDCVLVGGDSGGPLFDMDGNVIGIHSRITRSTAGNMHVAIDTYRDNWKRLEQGEVWPGARSPDDPFLGVYLNERVRGRAEIEEVMPDTPASAAGFENGDVVLRFGKEVVRDSDELLEHLQVKKPGDQVRVEVRRREETLSLDLTIGRRGNR